MGVSKDIKKWLIIAVSCILAGVILLFGVSGIRTLSVKAAETNASATINMKYADVYDFSSSYSGYTISSIKTGTSTDSKIAVKYNNSTTKIRATGVGDGVVTLTKGDTSVDIKLVVSKATVDVLFVAGQSNAEGACYNGYNSGQTVANKLGQVFSTFPPGVVYLYESITGTAATETCAASNVNKYIPKDFVSGLSRSGDTMDYSIDILASGNHGKTGIDSGLAYSWQQASGNKVWVINTAWSGTSIDDWVPGGDQYKRTKAIYDACVKTLEEEEDAGHITIGKKVLFWQQGESDCDMDFSEYKTKFFKMFNSFDSLYGYAACGIISVRQGTEGVPGQSDVRMNGARLAQYAAALSKDNSKVVIASNVNEQWVTDSGVASYFKSAYSSGKLTYPMISSSASRTLPTTVAQTNSDLHYTQVAHNENGLTAGKAMYKYVYGKTTSASSATWRNDSGETITEITVGVGRSKIAVPYTEPCTATKLVTVSASDSNISYDTSTCEVTGNAVGTSYVNVTNSSGTVIGKLKVSVVEKDPYDLSSAAGDDYTGIFYNKSDDNWYYLSHSYIDTSYNGFAENGAGTWYINAGRITFDKTGIYFDDRNSQNCYRYVENSHFTEINSVCEYNSSWWRVENGLINFDATGVYQNEYGWWYCENGKVRFDYTGIKPNEWGWWRIVGGQVDFSENTICENEYGWWKIVNGCVNFKANGVYQNKYGWWYVKGGCVDFSFTGIASNQYGRWYIRSGCVDFNKNGTVYYNGHKYKIKSGKVV